MNSTLHSRLSAVVGAAALIAGGAIIAAPAAQASGSDCAGYLAASPAPNRANDLNSVGCLVGGTNLPLAKTVCEHVQNDGAQVRADRAANACKLA
ncbi:hypothetical protein AQI88_41075 [Streptomyces cellostaticus]|uniref:Uncharacterized protein n=1 Tax=Streptomyces cellostaticus TaxID=67285 RepID=A0A101N507_9ACTN|nr:hypothetical protein [Streptomyces cellostaticus]KUM86679.1 hypothetical protein AQI88_41075 [Streptomyces cellostaticus]GHI10097.1 hypothetical protein Scel_84180 [Streptomyces cellostaticus]